MTDLRDQRICKSCRESRLKDRKSPRPLKLLPTTKAFPRPAYACEFCDGPAFKLSKLKASREG